MHHDLDRWLARALSIAEGTGADPELRGQLAAALGEVAAVQARTDALTRRERELAALYDTARDLAALRDLDVLLAAIVRRARTLLGTDVAYLTLRDPERGDTEMRVTDGSVSARFQGLRLPPGAGLGGLVAETGEPYATAHYFRDPRFHHTDPIDAAVGEEGLVAILGVPLQRAPLPAREGVMGVLFAADRTERPFDPEEIALLASLASLAAVAIDNARLLEETGRRLKELDEAAAVIRAHSASVERAADAHDRFVAVVLGGGDVGDLARAVVDAIGGALLVRDVDGRVLAEVGTVGAVPPPGPADRPGRLRRCGRAWVVGAAAGEELLGELVLTGADELDGAAVRTVERAAVVTALVLLVRRIAVTAEEQVRGELLVDLLIDPGRDPASVADRADRLAVSLAAPHCLVVATAALPRERLALAAARLARTRCGLSAAHLGASVLLLPGVAAGDAARSVSRALATALGGPVTAGAAGPVRSPTGIPAAYAEAERCRAALIRLGREGAGADAAELGYVGLLLAERADPAGFVTAALGPVLDYDARRGTELVRTMRAYFAAGQSPARAREELHVHVNTVVQRLERITALLGEGWQSPERVVELQLALRLATLLGYQ